MEDRIIQLAGSGVPQSVIADTVGCDPSYVSQLLSQEHIQEQVATLRLAKAAGMIKHDETIEDGEKTALARMLTLLPMQSDLMKITKVFQVLNSAKKSSDRGIVGAGQTPGTVVTLNIPAAAQVHFKLTSDRQVIEVEGRSLVPMPSHQVARSLRELQASRLLNTSLEMPTQPAISANTRSIVSSL